MWTSPCTQPPTHRRQHQHARLHQVHCNPTSATLFRNRLPVGQARVLFRNFLPVGQARVLFRNCLRLRRELLSQLLFRSHNQIPLNLNCQSFILHCLHCQLFQKSIHLRRILWKPKSIHVYDNTGTRFSRPANPIAISMMGRTQTMRPITSTSWSPQRTRIR